MGGGGTNVIQKKNANLACISHSSDWTVKAEEREQ